VPDPELPDEPELPDVVPELPEVPELPDDEPLPPEAVVSHLFEAHLASVLFRPAHFGFEFRAELEPLCAAASPEEPEVPAMLPLLVPMELFAPLSLLLLVVLPSEPEVEPLLLEAPLPLSDEPLPEVALLPLP